MPSGSSGLGITLALACASATVFLFLRCDGRGRPFGASARWWAVAAIAVTSVVSTAAAFVVVNLLNQLPSAFVGIGMLTPSWLWLSEIHRRGEDRRSMVRDLSTLWLTRLLAHLHEGMAEDRLTWCEERVDQNWSTAELALAARHYHEYLRERLTPEQRRRGRFNALHNAIESRLDVAQLIENGAGQSKIRTALRASRFTNELRYTKFLDDLGGLRGILHHDAERDLVRLLGVAYLAGSRRLAGHRPQVRAMPGPPAPGPIATAPAPAVAAPRRTGRRVR